MNRGDVVKDPGEDLSLSSRYSRNYSGKNSLLYADSSAFRKAKRAAKKRECVAAKTVKGNHNSIFKGSVGHAPAIGHQRNRLEVGSGGRLFGVWESNHIEAKSGASSDKTCLSLDVGTRSVRHDVLNVSAPVNSDNINTSSGAGTAYILNNRNPAGKANNKPNRPYIADHGNPLLLKRRGKSQRARENAPLLSESSSVTALKFFGRWQTISDALFRSHRFRIIAVVSALTVASYSYVAWHFSSLFYPGTKFYGIEAYNMSVDEVKAAISLKVNSYSLTLKTRNPGTALEEEAGNNEEITENYGETIIAVDGEATESAGSTIDGAGNGKTGNNGNVIRAQDVDLSYVDNGEIDKALEDQMSIFWPVMMIVRNIQGRQNELITSYDCDCIGDVLESLPCFQDENIIAPENAELALTDGGAIIVPEVYGTTLDYEKTREAVIEALDNGEDMIDLDALGLYINPTYFSSDLSLISEVQALNKVLGAKITLDFGDRSEIINSSVIYTFLTKGDGSYSVDEGKVCDYVGSLAEKYDTLQTERSFYTSIGTVVTLEAGNGDYGWQIDQEATKDAIITAVLNQETVTMEPVYAQEAWCREANDIGKTYVEINITDQMMWFYSEGMLVVKTPIVTGDTTAGRETPANGVWYIKGKYRNQVLKGEGYSSPVDYWLPFNGGIGIHDMQNRYYFGGTIYIGYGSHGCINTPLCAVKLIYNSIEEGVPVIVYEDDSMTAQELISGATDILTITNEVEQTFGSAEDDGSGSIVYWTAQQEAAETASQAQTAGGSSEAS